MYKFGRALSLAACTLFGQPAYSVQAIQGKQVSNTSCAVGYCHGLDGRAGRGPRLRDRVWAKSYLYRTIEQGIPGSSMPAWQGKISEEKIAAVVSYILSISKEQTGPEVESEKVQATPSAAAIDPPGKALFFDLMRDRNCGVCHRLGETGAMVAAPFRSFQGVPARALLAQIKSQPASASTVDVRLLGRDEFCGIEAAADPQYFRVYDLGGTGPPVLRIIDKQIVLSVRPCPSLNVHASNRVLYSSLELESIVDFLTRQ